ncbi:class I SAM-dependent methyltransferase [Pacificimonas aurantium]|uniref:Class I SAM-dependent methyltransferase n=1 Tax=Pacificimonas aurantium TaxID=1250540 RepID=A0ABS7WI23_9SPHN|nr:class I SAM-dependent methyltransferase [Pacificimonas aurantium]MBZ6377242.1 class I SAM-dependent methyltransferase [Pacificimonas aurantium]
MEPRRVHGYQPVMRHSPDHMREARQATHGVYERNAAHWNRARLTSLYEKPWLDRFIAAVPAGCSLLDLGCGSGVPIAGYLLDRGFTLTGIDYSPAMIGLARENYPGADWRVGDMKTLPPRETFGGIYSWDGFFHLSVDEQRLAIPELCRLTLPGGAIMLTVGTGEGEVTGTVAGESVYHASLAPEEYDRRFRDGGFQTVIYVAEDPECLGRSILLASDRRP